jgi:hypothetical protein
MTKTNDIKSTECAKFDALNFTEQEIITTFALLTCLRNEILNKIDENTSDEDAINIFEESRNISLTIKKIEAWQKEQLKK